MCSTTGTGSRGGAGDHRRTTTRGGAGDHRRVGREPLSTEPAAADTSLGCSFFKPGLVALHNPERLIAFLWSMYLSHFLAFVFVNKHLKFNTLMLKTKLKQCEDSKEKGTQTLCTVSGLLSQLGDFWSHRQQECRGHPQRQWGGNVTPQQGLLRFRGPPVWCALVLSIPLEKEVQAHH